MPLVLASCMQDLCIIDVRKSLVAHGFPLLGAWVCTNLRRLPAPKQKGLTGMTRQALE
jgi:hypothetical protein